MGSEMCIRDSPIDPRWPKGRFSPRAGTISQSVIIQGGWGFHTLRGGIHQGKLLFSPEVIEVEAIKKIF